MRCSVPSRTRARTERMAPVFRSVASLTGPTRTLRALAACIVAAVQPAIADSQAQPAGSSPLQRA
jgi:hypothetical protein